MINMTASTGGYRLLPGGEHFSPYAELRITYDPERLPQGYTPDDIYTSFYDTSSLAWVRLERVEVDTINHEIVSLTTHFTDFINELLKAPEMPETQAFVPTVMSDLEAVSPMEGLTMIQPPAANNNGTANLTYPLVIPAGRGGMQPNLALTYSSSGGNGWLGVGWDIPIPAITLDTRWGVPRYDTTYETEIYLLNGEQLVAKDSTGGVFPLPHRTNNRTGRLPDGSQFFARTGDAHDSIVRHGDSPKDYWWEVVDRNGITHYYGHYFDSSRNEVPILSLVKDTNTIIVDSSNGSSHFYMITPRDTTLLVSRHFPTTIYDGNNNIAKWVLTESRDMYGNTIRYYYDRATVRNRGAVGKQLYIDSISYTGYNETDGYYTIVFCRTGNNTPDIPISCNLGFKETSDQLLNNVYLKCGDDIQTIWHFETENGDSTNYKNRLTSITKIDSVGDWSMRNFLDTICHCIQQDEDDYGTAPYILKPRDNGVDGHDSLILRYSYVKVADSIPHDSIDKYGNPYTVYKYGFHYELQLVDSVWVTVFDTIHWRTLSLKELQQQYNLEYAGTTIDFDYYDAPANMFGDEVTMNLERSNAELHGYLMIGGDDNDGIDEILRRATALGLSTSSNWNIKGTAALGAGANVCLTNSSVGGNYTRTGSSNETLMTLVDLDGDGLSDKVYIKGGKMFFCRHHAIDSTNFYFDSPQEIMDVQHFMETSNTGKTKGVQAELKGLSGSVCWTESKSVTSTYFSDVNGDGLVDLVRGGQVHFNHRGIDGVPMFTRYSDFPTMPQENDGYEGDTMNVSDSTCGDIIFDGAVSDSINCRRVWDLLDTFTTALSDRDYYSWLNSRMKDTVYLTTPIKESLLVEVYHRVWDCSYHDESLNTDAVRVWIAPDSGIVDISSTVRLIEDTSVSRSVARHADGTILSIQHSSNIESGSNRFHSGSTNKLLMDSLICSTCYTDTIKITHRDTVARGDMIFFRLRSRDDRHFDNIHARFTINYIRGAEGHYDSEEDFVLSSNHYFQAPANGSCTIYGTLDDDGEPVSVQVSWMDHPYTPPTSPEGVLFSQVVTKGDSIRVVLIPANDNIQWGKVTCKPRILFQPSDDAVFYDTTFNGSTGDIERIDTIHLTDTIGGWLAPQVELNDTCSLYTIPLYQRLFGPLHKGWGQFAYQSEGTDADTIKIERLIPSDMMVLGNNNTSDSIRMAQMTGVSIDSTCFSQSQTIEDFQRDTNIYSPYSTRSAWVEMSPDAKHWVWVSHGHQNVVGSNMMSNSVQQEWYSDTPYSDSAEDHVVDVPQVTYYDDAVPPAHHDGTPAKAVLKVNSTNSRTWSTGFSSFGATYSDGSNVIEKEYMDLNGDRYPDIIGTDMVQYSQQWGGIGPVTELPSVLSHGGASHTWSAGLSYSASPVKIERMDCHLQQNAFFSTYSKGSGGINGEGNIGHDKAGGYWLDINGDGLTDFVYPSGLVQLNIGYGFIDDGEWDYDNVRSGVSGAISSGIVLEGYADEITTDFLEGVTNICQASIEAGAGLEGSYNQTTHMMLDINGDGLPDKLWRELDSIDDIIHGDVISTKVRYNLGAGKFSGADTLDIGRFHSSATFSESLNMGMTFGSTFWGFKITAGLNVCPLSNNVSKDYVQLADINADGLADWVYSNEEGEMSVRFNQSGRTNLLKSVSNFTGSSFRLDYTLSDASYDQPSRGWLMTRVTTDDPLNPNGGHTSITEYTYSHPRYDRYERTSYGFDSVVAKHINPATGDTLRFVEHGYDNRSFVRRGKPTCERIYDGNHRLYVEKLMESTMIDYNSCDTVGDHDCPIIAYPAVEGTYTKYYEGGNTALLVVREVTEYDRYHNVIHYTDHGDFSNPSDGLEISFVYYPPQPGNLIGLRESYTVTPTGASTPQREAHFEYNGHGRLTKQTLGSGPNAPVYEFEYDTIYGNLAKGTLPENLSHQRMFYSYTYDTTVHTYPVRTDNAYGEYSSATYDYRFGKPLTVTDISHNAMTYSYDFAGRLATVSSPMSSGAPTLENRYHPVNYYHGGCTPQGYSYTPSPTGHPYSVTLHYDDTGNLITRTAVLTDGFGRVLQTKKGLTANGTVAMQVSGRTFVDALGRAIRQHDPFTSADTSITHLGTLDTSQSTTLMATTAYDVLDRVDSTVQPLGITTLSHHDISNRRFVTTTTDPNGNITKQYYDYEGRQVQVTDADGGITTMHYDNLGQLIWTKDPEGFQTTYDYDNLGRLVRRIHPDAGTTTFTYDPAGNLMKETNPLGGIFYSYTYYRPKEKRYSYMTGNDVTYTYGTSGNDIGRPVRITDGSGSYECHYDKLGNVTDEIRTIALPYNSDEVYRFHMGYTYDSWGRMLSMTYPDGEKITYTYQWGGDLRSMHGVKNSNHRTYIREIRYNPFGQKKQVNYGNGTQAQYSYDALHRLANLRSYDSLGSLMQKLDYTFDNASNITFIKNSAGVVNSLGGGYENNYHYDNLHRLTHSDGGGVAGNYDMDMAYTPSGRIIWKHRNAQSSSVSETVDMYYGYCDKYQPHAVKRMFDYKNEVLYDLRWDDAGNLGQVSMSKPGEIFDAGRFLFWTEDNRMHAAVDDKYFSYYVYDHSGERRLKLTGDNKQLDVNADFMVTYTVLNEPTLYPSAYMVLTNKGYTKHYYAGTERVAARIGGGCLKTLEKSPKLQKAADLLFKQSHDQTYERMLKDNDLGCIKNPAEDIPPLHAWIDGIPDRMKARVDVDDSTFRRMICQMTEDCEEEPDVYFYHSDHLSSASWITDSIGIPIQHLQYLPYGALFVDQRTTGYHERFTFTGKEKDEETGYSYFGARYMDHELLTSFISVDRYASKYPFISPYAYCAWNPIRLTDPTGDTLFALDRESQVDIMSLAGQYRKRVLFNDRGVASLDYTGMSSEEKEAMNSDPGVALIKDIVESPLKILYESTDVVCCTNPDGSKTVGAVLNDRSKIVNLSRFGLDSNDELPYLPRDGYDGQVVISPNAKYYSDGFLVLRTEIIGHELAENYARTVKKLNYKYPPEEGKQGTHQYANERMNNPHKNYSVRYKPQFNIQYKRKADEYLGY